MNPWKALVIKHKAKSVKPIPDGWLTKAQVAERIGCTEGRVGENLRAAIKAKDVLVDKFPVWDAIEGKIISVQFYSIPGKKTPTSPASKKLKWPFPEKTLVRRRDGVGTGVVISGGRVKWDSGSITAPKGSSIHKLVPV